LSLPGYCRKGFEDGRRSKVPQTKPPRSTPFFSVVYLGRLGSGPRLVGRIGSAVRVSASFQKNSHRECCPTDYGGTNRGYDLGGFVGGFLTSYRPRTHFYNNPGETIIVDVVIVVTASPSWGQLPLQIIPYRKYPPAVTPPPPDPRVLVSLRISNMG